MEISKKLESRRNLLSASLFLFIALVLCFDELLLEINRAIGGELNASAYSLWHLWWPQFWVGKPDGLVVHAYNSTPYWSNHLLNTPIFQSFLFGLLNKLVGSPILSFKLLLIFSFAATFLGLYRFLISKKLNAVIAGLGSTTFVLSPWYTTIMIKADVIAASLWLLPLALLIWDLWLNKPSIGRMLLVVITLYLAVLSGIQHISWLVNLWLPYAIWTAYWQIRREEQTGHHQVKDKLNQLLWASILLLILFLIYPIPNLVRSLQGYTPPFSVLSPLSDRSLVGALKLSSPVLLVVLLITVLVRRQFRGNPFWLIVTGILFLVAYGIFPDLLGLFARIINYPSSPLYNREMFYGLMILSGIVYIATEWQVLWEAWANPLFKWGAVLAFLLAIVFTNPQTWRAFENHPPETHDFYTEIASEPEDYAILVYPAGILSVQNGIMLGNHPYLVENAVWHHKRTVTGILPYAEPRLIAEFENMAFLYPAEIPSHRIDSSAEMFREAVNEWRIGYIVVHSNLLTNSELQTIDLLAQQSGAVCPADTRGELIIYRAKWHPFGCGE